MTGAPGILDLILSSGIVAKIVLLILLGLSIVSWAVIADRWRFLKRARAQSHRFFQAFRTHPDMGQVFQAAAQWPDSPPASVFRAVYNKYSGVIKPDASGARNPGDTQNMIEAVYRELDRAGHAELARFEKPLTLLATAASVSPFLGLFGTVWGVMTAFLDISAKGSTNIVVVAPGIAEALITTVAGLAVAIPALVAYNYFVQSSRRFGIELEDMATSLLNLIQYKSKP